MQQYHQVQAKCIGYFAELFVHSLASIPAVLTERIGSSETDRERHRYLDAREALEAAGGQPARDFEAALADYFDAFAVNREQVVPDALDVAQLRLIDKAQYEDDVVTRAIATKTAALNAEELWKLHRRFAILRGGKKFADEVNPCGPHRLCCAIQEAYRSLEVDSVVRLLLYRSFEQDVLCKAGDFYAELNAELAEGGILKNLGFDVVRETRVAVGGGAPPPVQASPTAPPRPAPTGANPPAANDPGEDRGVSATEQGNSVVPLVSPEQERRQARIVNAIRSVQRKRSESGQGRTRTLCGAEYGALASDGLAGNVDTFSAATIASVVSKLQADLRIPAQKEDAVSSVGTVEKALFDALDRQSEAGLKTKITGLDADTIDLVGMLFDCMLDDPHLPDSLKSLLSHLHTPYLKVALLDPVFFGSADHPARKLLDLLAAVGVRWLQEGEDDEKVYQRTRHLVERVVGEFKDDVQFFEDVLNDFARFVRVLEKRSDLSEQRSRETEKGLDQLNHAKAVASGAVRSRIAGVPLAGQVKQLLVQPWVDYLVFTYLRHGSQSEAWYSALAVVDGVVQSLKPGSKSRTKEERAQLSGALTMGLNSIGCDSQRIERLLGALHTAQQHALEGGGASVKASPTARRLSAIGRQMESQRGEEKSDNVVDVSQLSAREQALAQQLSTIEFGTWFEFRSDGPEKRQRLKLSWYSSMSGNYMFVNAVGMKCAVRPLRGLVRGLVDGSVLIIDQEHRNLFERAVSSVLLRLRDR